MMGHQNWESYRQILFTSVRWDSYCQILFASVRLDFYCLLIIITGTYPCTTIYRHKYLYRLECCLKHLRICPHPLQSEGSCWVETLTGWLAICTRGNGFLFRFAHALGVQFLFKFLIISYILLRS